MTAAAVHNRFAGVVKIVQFNLPFYIASGAGLLAVGALLASGKLPRRSAPVVRAAASLMAWWTMSSLLVSWYVYDYAGVTRWEWIRDLAIDPARWANIHAGLDESTAVLRRLFPHSASIVIDIYDPAEMSKPSIARARQMYPATEPFLPGRCDALPLPDDDRDAIFLLVAAHEVRDRVRRTQLLREAARVLTHTGHIVLVEHLRDWKNLAAFGPGFLHFHSRQSWQQSIRDAGLRTERETQLTPFVRCFLLRKADA